jgi:hypothetical protein
MFIKGIAIFLQFILLQSANEIKAKRATLFLLLGHPLVNSKGKLFGHHLKECRRL